MIPSDAELCLEGWTYQTRYAETVALGNIEIQTEGLIYSHPHYGVVSGSSSSHLQESSKAYFELIERVSLVRHLFERNNSYYNLRCPFDGTIQGKVKREHVFPVRNRSDVNVVPSNGVALHDTWSEACKGAALELVERHLLLESFYGRLKPSPIDAKGIFKEKDLGDLYEERSYFIGSQKVDAFPDPIFVVASLLLPKDPERNHQIAAFGAGFDLNEAHGRAQKEVLQRYSFVYDSEIPSEVAFEASGMYHQNFHFQSENHWQVRDWLEGKFYSGNAPIETVMAVDFVDLSLPELHSYAIAKAISGEAHELVWGLMDPSLFEEKLLAKNLVHPIP